MYRWWLVLVVGCYRPSEIDSCNTLCGADPGRVCPPGQLCDGNGICKPEDMTGDCPSPDAAVDAFEFADGGLDAVNTNQTCFGGTDDFFKVCVPRPLPPAETITSAIVIDTDQCVQYQPQNMPPLVCVRAWSSLTLAAGASIRAVGSRPLAIVVEGSFVILGTIDAASHFGGQRGANANVSDCAPPQGGSPGVTATGGGGGGGGGALGAAGAAGGTGSGLSPGGGETPPIDPSKLMRLRGGCPGGDGGKSTTGFGGAGGAGGGAIYLMSKGEIELGPTAIINASGAGGNPPGVRGGGGGGGSGGFIGFHAALYTIDASARIFAVGGSGASGGSSTGPGKAGNEATGPMDAAPTLGSAGSGTGGFGAVIKGGGGGGGTLSTGGGGGGGGGGVIGFEGPIPAGGLFAPSPRLL